ncbi:unnamed protein product [Caenorhabditis sp. 36 PRJEB53466]|nr:unnamed protein product [Caenorhabditis sp. 36 PRJEB53466]
MFDYIPKAILPLGFFMFFCALIGVIGNFVMLLCSFRTKRFRSPCHILITATCLADAIHISGQFPFCVHLFGNLTSSQAQCYWMLTAPIVGLTSGGPLILAMGIDRLIAVRYPTRYRYFQEEPKFYICAQLLFPIGYAVFFLVYGFLVRNTDVKNQITCANPLALNGTAFQMFTYSSGLICIFVFFVYLTVYILLKSNKASARFKSVFRSLAVTVGLVMFGWVSTTTANTLSYSITDSTYTAQLIQMYAGITVNTAAASNVFVFYAINSDYREVIKALFGCKSKTNSPLFEASSTMVTEKRRMTLVRLRSPCHILISLTCISDLFHLTAQFVYCVHLFGNLTCSQSQCFYMLIMPLSGVGASGPLILAMGVDRLIAVKFPTKYRLLQQEPKFYVLAHLISPIVYTLVLLYFGYSTRIVDEKIQVACAVPVALNGTAFQFFTYSNALIYFIVVIVYGTVYILLKSNKASARFKSVFKSIAVTVGFVLFGWVTTTLTNTLSYEVTSDTFTAQIMQMYAGITVNFAAAANVFIFYAIKWVEVGIAGKFSWHFSSEYREVIKSLFGCDSKMNTAMFEASSNMVSVSATSQIQKRNLTMT